MADLSPILLFTFNRLTTLQQTIQSLQNNTLASKSDLFIFSDAAKSNKDLSDVRKVREYLKSITGFKKIQIIESEAHKGLAASVINGVTKIINQYDRVIVLEDDLLLSCNFLCFMNSALEKYEKNKAVYSISGYMFDTIENQTNKYDVFFTKRHCSWGWAMWKDRWNEIDWDVTDFHEFHRSSTKRKAFNQIGSDLSRSLIRQMNGEINSWAIRCAYHQFKMQTFTVYPLKSKVVNIGFGKDATHTKQRFNKFKATLDHEPKLEFLFPENVFEDRRLLRIFRAKYSRRTRLWYFILNKIVK
jgi:GNT-I family